jgi:hypothetical protein
VLMPVGMARVQLRIAHEAQNARRSRLQHIHNNDPNAVAKGSQNSMSLVLHIPAGRRI